MIIGKIDSNIGYTKLKIDVEEIVSKYDIILHIIDPKKILDIVNNLEVTLNTVDFGIHKGLIQNEIYNLKHKIDTLIPHRRNRGLFNGFGTILKWVYGTMDNNDRENIENHFLITDQNNHQLINNMNQQVRINDNFNKTFTQLKNVIELDRKKITEKMNYIDKVNSKIIKETYFVEQMFKLNIIKEQVEHIQQNIVSAKSGILQPNILTSEEIIKYNIDFKKLLKIRLGIAETNDEKIIFAIKLPVETIKVDKILIIPITNKDSKEIDFDAEYIVEIQNKTYTFIENKPMNELKLSKHCIIYKNCKFIKNTEEEIIEIANNILILKNCKNKYLNNTCNKTEHNLNGNYMITFNNCTLNIENKKYSNKIYTITKTFITPVDEDLVITQNQLTFDEIVLKQENNIKTINELKYHKVASYGIGSIAILITIIFAVIILCKHKKLKVKIINRIQENPKTREGRVTYDNKNADIVSAKTVDTIYDFDKLKTKYNI